jgi:hypothetical protein
VALTTTREESEDYGVDVSLIKLTGPKSVTRYSRSLKQELRN